MVDAVTESKMGVEKASGGFGKLAARRVLAMMCGAALVGGAAACGSGGGSGSSSGTIGIGALIATTSQYSFAGTDEQAGVKTAIQVLSKDPKYKGHTFDLQSVDEAGNTTRAMAGLRKFANDSSVVGVVGPTASPVGNAIAPVANQMKIPMISLTSSNDVAKGDWTFKILTDPDAISSEVAHYAVSQLHAKRVATVDDIDNSGQTEEVAGFTDAVKKAGGTIVYQGHTNATASNFGPVASRVVSSHPDVVFITVVGEQMAPLVAQFHQAGLPKSVKFLGTRTMFTSDFPTSSGVAHCCDLVTDWSPFLGKSQNKTFTNAYRKETNHAPTTWAAVGYAATMTIGHAVARCMDSKITRQCVQQQMAKLRGDPSILGTGTLSMDPKGIAQYKSSIISVGDGKFVPVGGGQ